MIAILNAHMFGSETEPGEHVDWSTPDVDTVEGWTDTLGMDVVEYAATAPHMIVFEIPWEDALMGDPAPELSAAEWQQLADERAASLQYAADNGYDVDPTTGRYLPPEGVES